MRSSHSLIVASPRTCGIAAMLATTILTLTSPVLAAEDPPDDPWFGHDKLLHFTISTGIGAVSYGACRTQSCSRPTAWAFALGTTMAIGAAKEGVDAMGYGDPSWRDLTWDLAGAFVGTLVAWGIDLALEPESSTPRVMRPGRKDFPQQGMGTPMAPSTGLVFRF